MSKKIFLLFFLSVFTVFTSFASNFIVPTVVDVRSSGMGGVHLCDFNNPFVMLNNPSGMVFSGKQVLFPSLSMDFGLPPKAPAKFFGMIKGGGKDNLINTLVDLLKGSNGIFIDADVTLPLTFSRVANNWGIGFYNNVFIRGDLPSVSSMKAVAGGDLMIAGGYSYPVLKAELHKLSLGISTKLLGRFSVVHKGAVTGLTSLDFKSIPSSMTLAMGFDVGLTYKFWDYISVSAVWKDLYLGMDKNLGSISSISFSNGSKWDKFLHRGDLNFGVGFHIPTGILKKVLSSFEVYIDYVNFTQLFDKQKAVFLPHPLLNLSMGMEAVLFKSIALRFGMVGAYLAGGLGIDIGVFHMSMSIYGKEKGIDPGQSPQVGGALALAFYY